MKVFIIADIEGTNGIANWDEADKDNPNEYSMFAKRMTLEVASICHGVNDYDDNAEIRVSDSHDTGRNIDHELLPENVWLRRVFSGSPFRGMHTIDEGFDASMVSGYHSPAYTNGNPLAHTVSSSGYSQWLVNGKIFSEFHMAYYSSLYHDVPMVMVSGDELMMQIVNETDPDILTVTTLRGMGKAVLSPHPNKTRMQLRETAKRALDNVDRLKSLCASKMPPIFDAEVRFKDHARAYMAKNYPGAKVVDDHTVGFCSKDYLDFLKFFQFV